MESKEITRPKWTSEMHKEISEYVGKILNEWCDNETDIETCIEDASDVMQWNKNSDGYELAKEFEDKGYNSDRQLVDDLDDVAFEISNIQTRHVEKWVKENGLVLPLTVGCKAKYKVVRKGEYEGEIVELYPETYRYGFWYDGIGYEKGKGHIIIPAEEVLLVSNV